MFNHEHTIESYLERHEHKEMLRFLTCGSVDDGKSTLIGRLLYDTKTVYEDQIKTLHAESQKIGNAGDAIDFSLLVDGLQSEREQGITIDVAYRYFSTEKRKFIIADTPGHEQYTRNMVTGASNADAAIILIDAQHGVTLQTKRHSFITHLMGISHLIVAINKMDIVHYDETIFQKIKADFETFFHQFDSKYIHFIPVSALHGINIVTSSHHMPWYQGKTLIDTLETLPLTTHHQTKKPFCLPVQYVNRPNSEFRGYTGTIASGDIAVHDTIKVLPSGECSTVKEIIVYNEKLLKASHQMAITLTLNDELDISRGNMIVSEHSNLVMTSHFKAFLIWMAEAPLDLKKSYLLKTTNTSTPLRIEELLFIKDIHSLEEHNGKTLQMNEIGLLNFHIQDPLALSTYESNHLTGSFILIDRWNNTTVAAGMVTELLSSLNPHHQTLSHFQNDLDALVARHFPNRSTQDIIKELYL